MSTLRVDNIQDQGGAERRGLKTYAIICDEKAHNAHAGTFTSGAWRTRDLNTEIADPEGIVSISNNQFTLSAGDYLIEASAPAFDCDRHQLRIYNATTSAVVQYGTNCHQDDTDSVQTIAPVVGRVTITGDTVFEIQHRCSLTKSTHGLGLDNGFGGVSIYCVVKIYKEA